MPVSSFSVKDMMEEDMHSRTYQLQTMSNLYNSIIPNEIISSQLDITEVQKAIEKITKETRGAYGPRKLSVKNCFFGETACGC